MAANPRMLATDTDVAWDGRIRRYPAGTIIDIPPGSALEAAYGGPDNLVDLSGDDSQAISAGSTGSAAGPAPDATPPDQGDQGGNQQ